MKHYLLPILFLVSGALPAQPQLALIPVPANGLNAPLQVVNAADGSNRFFVVQKGGGIRVYGPAWDFLGNFLHIPEIGGGGEGGLLSMVFHPDYANNGLFYVYYTNAAGDLDLARYQVYPNNPNLANPSSKVLLLSIPHPDIYHYGGELHFGNDGFLYLSTGDGGNPGDMVNNAQNPNVLLGKMLRIAVDTSSVAPYYSIPADNPFGNEVYALGFRNPFRWSFDRLTHDIWVADVGSSIREEINFLPAGSTPGANFGWSCLEGEFSFNPSFCLPGLTTITPAFAYYSLPPVSVIGGVVYRGAAMPDLQGYYMAADYFSGNWYLLSPDGNGGWNTTIQNLPVKGIADFGESETGEVYVVSITENTIYQLGLAGSATEDANQSWAAAIQVYPNLLSSPGSIQISYPGIALQSLQLSNPAGKVLLNRDISGTQDQLLLELPAMLPGIYWLKLTAASGWSVVRKVVLR